MNRNNLSKMLSTSLSLALAVTSMPMPAVAAGPVASAPAFVAKLTPPAQFGYVASSYAPKGESNPRMVLISDLHAHVEVQRNIKGILEHLVGQLRATGSPMANKKMPIFVEGGWEPKLEEPLKTIGNPSVRSFLAEYFLHKAEINAAQAYSEKVAGTNQVALIGVESKAEYFFNRAQFLKTYPARKALLAKILREEEVIRELTSYLANDTFARLQELRDGYNAGRVRMETFARALTKMARRHKINNGHVRSLQNLSTASQSDIDVALTEVYRSVLKSVSEKRPMSAFLRQSIKNEDTIRGGLARIDASLDLLKRLVSNQLTPSEVPLALARMSELTEVALTLLSDSPLKESAPKVIRDSFNFYPFAKLRDVTLGDNSLKALESFGSDATGILVTGGFHTDVIAERLRAKNVSYIIIHPNITRDLTSEEHNNYMSRMGGEHVGVAEIEKDIQSLRGGKFARSQASAPVMANIDSPKKDGQNYLGEVDVAKIATILGNDQAALRKQLESAKPIFDANIANYAKGSKELAAAQNQVIDVARAEKALTTQQLNALEGAIQMPSNMFISLSQISEKNDYQTSAGLTGEDAQALATLVNKVKDAAEGGQQKASSIGQIHVIGIDNAVEQLGSTARVFIDEKSGERTIVMDKQRLQNWIAGRKTVASGALDRAEQNLIHELVHIFDVKGKSETATVLKSLAIQVTLKAQQAAQNGAGEAEVRNVISRVVSSFLVDLDAAKGDSVFKSVLTTEGLVQVIANAFSPVALSTENAQKIFEALQAIQPEKTDFQIQQDIEKLTAGVYSLGSLTGDDGVAQAKQILQNIGRDLTKEPLTNEEIERIVEQLAKMRGIDLAAARAILNAA